MFQNINEGTIDEREYEQSKRERRKIEILTNVFKMKNIPVYIVSLMISMVGITGEISPFSISILGACLVNGIPLLGVVIFSIIGSILKFGISGVLRIYINNISINSNNICNKTNI